MRIEFQYNLDEWLEWNRSNFHPVHVVLFRIAETSLMPLYFLCGLSILLVSLPFLKLLTVTTSHIPDWLPILILFLIAVAQIYLSRNPNLRSKALKKEWQDRIAKLKYDLEVTEKGVDSTSKDLTDEIAWDEITSVYQTKQLLIFYEDKHQVLLIPKRAFKSGQQLEDFLELAHRKTVVERE